MKIDAQNVTDYLEKIPKDRQEAVEKLYTIISENLPEGFQAGISYGMIGWEVPLEIYPKGYHCGKNQPLPFLSLASQKNFVNLYHMGIYANAELYDWFVSEYPKHSKRKLDMGKSCIRFKVLEDIPYDLIAALAQKMTPQEWVALHEEKYRKG